MPVSIFELFKIGVRPSSSHALGPMIAAVRFAEELAAPSTGGLALGQASRNADRNPAVKAALLDQPYF